MGIAVSVPPVSERSKLVFAAACVVHAMLVAAYWWASWMSDVSRVVPYAVWLVGAWAWFGWPITLVAARAWASKATIGATVIGGIFVVPTLFTLVLLTMAKVG